jgi:hypothetical protein
MSRRSASRPCCFDCRRNGAAERDLGRSTVQYHARVSALQTRVDDGHNAVTIRSAHKSVSGFSVGSAKIALAENDGIAVDWILHEFLPVSKAT